MEYVHQHSTAAQPKVFEDEKGDGFEKGRWGGKVTAHPSSPLLPIVSDQQLHTATHTIPHPFGVGQPNTQDQGWPLLLHQSWASVDHPRQKIGLMVNDSQRYNMLKAVGDLCFSLIHHFQAEPPPVMMIIKNDIRNMIMTQEV